MMDANLERTLSSIGLLGGTERVLLLGVILYGAWQALRRANLKPQTKIIAAWGITVALITWAGTVWGFAVSGTLQTFAQTSSGNAIALLAMPIILIVSSALFFAVRSAVIGAALDATPFSWLIGIQAYRLLGVVFVKLWLSGLVPWFFGLSAGLGDILVGLSALPVAMIVRSNSPSSRKAAYIWNSLGIFDLINAVSMGAISVALRHAARGEAGVSPMLTYPFVMVPAFGVPLAFILHGLSVLQLHRRSPNSFPNRLTEKNELTLSQNPVLNTAGLIIHWPARYDLLIWLFTLGRETAFREKVVNLAQLKAGESVLDIGCGTGSLAIAAKRQVGQKGTVVGIDASPEMLARARKKAKKAGVDVEFRNEVAEALPFHDAQFDAVLSTVMLHHLPEDARKECMRQVRTVLKPGGRLLAVDFGGAPAGRRSLIGHFHRHAIFDLREEVSIIEDAGLRPVQSGEVGLSDLQFVLAR